MNAIQIIDANGTESPSDIATPQNRVAELQQASSRSDARQNYSRLVYAVKELVQFAVPNGKTILVITKGDEELLDLHGRCGWHFPRAVNGKYAGCYPANSAEAITHLEKLRSQGAEFLVIPSSGFWWLEYYVEFTKHLQQQYRISTFQEDVCIIYRLAEDSAPRMNTQDDRHAVGTGNYDSVPDSIF